MFLLKFPAALKYFINISTTVKKKSAAALSYTFVRFLVVINMRFFRRSGFMSFKKSFFSLTYVINDFINLTATYKFVFCFYRTSLTLLLQINMSFQKQLRKLFPINPFSFLNSVQ
jgi:hypothetical protein